MRQSEKRTKKILTRSKKNVKISSEYPKSKEPSVLDKISNKITSAFKSKTDFADVDILAGKPDDVDARKWRVLHKVLKKAELVAPEIARKIKDNEVELVGVCERVTYHKMHKGEDMPYTHVFENPTVLLKEKNSSELIIFSEHIIYENKFIEG